MQEQNSGMSCQLRSWALAAGLAILLIVLLLIFSSMGFLGSLLWGIVAFVILGFLLNWFLCRDEADAQGASTSHAGNASAAGTAASTSAASSSGSPEAPAQETTPAPAASETPAPVASETPKPAASEAASSASAAASGVKPSTPLPGQDDLASRKGEWKYEGGNNQAAKSADASAPEAPAAAPAAPAATEATPDYDGDGILEGADEGKKPATLTAAREGGADNLKEIKGVGPKLEQLLNSMGFYHFDQIANWSADEVAWVNANLQGFKGRVSRDNWVEQAKILAAGGETEFSKRVDKGGVY